MADKLKIDLEIATKQAQADLKAAAKESKALGESLDGTRSAGKIMADSINALATEVEADLAGVITVSEKLANALGPEFVAKTNGSMDSYIADLRKGGLTLDDIEADVDELAAAIKHMDDVADKVKGFQQMKQDADKLEGSIKNVDSAGNNLDGLSGGVRRVGDDFDKVSDQADNTRSVVANFTGNTISELPGISGALGPLNMAIGQFGEYAAEGNIKLKNLIAAGAGIGAVALLTSKWAEHTAEIAATKAWQTDQVKGYVEALKDGEDAAGALVERLREAGTIDIDLSQLMDFAGVRLDIAPVMAKNGISVDAFARAVTGGQKGLDNFEAAMSAAGVSSENQTLIMETATQQSEFYAEAQGKAAVFNEVFGQSADSVSESIHHQSEAAREGAESTHRFQDEVHAAGEAARDSAAASDDHERSLYGERTAADAVTEALRGQKRVHEELIGIKRGAIDAEYAYEAALDQAGDAAASLTETMKDQDATLEDVDDATRTARDAVIGASEAYATMKGAALDSDEGVRLQIESLYAQASAMDANSPLRKAIVDHIGKLQAIPGAVTTVVDADTSPADAALLALRQRNTTLSMQIVAKGGAGYFAGPVGATGGIVTKPTVALIGEAGPEAVIPLNRTPGSSPLPSDLGGGGGGGNVINHITIQTGADPQQVIGIVKQYTKNGGRF